MGWASGASLLSDVVGSLVRNVPDVETRKKVYRDLISSFRNEDCDVEECMGEDDAFDQVIEDKWDFRSTNWRYESRW